MNKFFVSVGLATAGAAAFQTSCLAQSSMLESPKIWNVSAQLDGFYDDNYATAANNKKEGSFGLEFSPTISADLPLTQTEIGVLYTYGLQYYEQRDHIGVNPVDQDHTFNLWVDHSFNERWNAKVSDTFVDGQEPALLNSGGTGGSPLRLNGDNIANNASIDLHTDWTRLFSTDLTYGNGFYQYSQSGYGVSTNTPSGFYSVYTGGAPGTANSIYAPSYAGSLNRVQNSIDLDLKWNISPQTVISVGYEFLLVNYTGDEIIGYDNVPNGTIGLVNGKLAIVPPYTYNGTIGAVYHSNSRDNDSHIAYLGIQENLLDSLVAAAKVGIQYVDDYNDPLQKTTSLEPYANLSLIYTYLPDCNAQIGFTQSRNATDVVSINTQTGSLTLDQESSTLYASVNHHFTPKLLVTVIGQWSDSTFNGGQYANQADTDYNLGVSASYAFTRHISGNVNYNYDDLLSPINTRGYDRNRISIGMSVAY